MVIYFFFFVTPQKSCINYKLAESKSVVPNDHLGSRNPPAEPLSAQSHCDALQTERANSFVSHCGVCLESENNVNDKII